MRNLKSARIFWEGVMSTFICLHKCEIKTKYDIAFDWFGTNNVWSMLDFMESMPPKQTYITIACALVGWSTNHANNNFLQRNSKNIWNIFPFYFVEGSFARPQYWTLIFCKIHQCSTFKRRQKIFFLGRISRSILSYWWNQKREIYAQMFIHFAEILKT